MPHRGQRHGTWQKGQRDKVWHWVQYRGQTAIQSTIQTVLQYAIWRAERYQKFYIEQRMIQVTVAYIDRYGIFTFIGYSLSMQQSSTTYM